MVINTATTLKRSKVLNRHLDAIEKALDNGDINSAVKIYCLKVFGKPVVNPDDKIRFRKLKKRLGKIQTSIGRVQGDRDLAT